MVRRYGWILMLMGLLALFITGCDSSDGADVDVDESGTVVSGRLAQTYVSGATVIADKVAADGIGNFRVDEGEVRTISDADGYYEFTIPPNYGEYVLCSKGGTVRNSRGARVPALPMLAPEGAQNLTLTTTLVALHPSLKNKIGADFDKDVANRNGVPWRILQIAKTAEAFLSVWNREEPQSLADISIKFKALKKYAVRLNDADMDMDDDIVDAVYGAVLDVLEDEDIEIDEDALVGDRLSLAAIFAGMTETILAAIQNSGVAVEADILPETEAAIAFSLETLDGNRLAFSPSDSILPLPNDIVWARTEGRVYLPPPADSPQQAALYTAINALELKGLSPNTPIAIPLENATPIDEAALQTNIRLINYSTMLGLVYGALELGNPAEATADEIIAGIKAQIAAAPQETMGIIQQTIGANMGLIFAGSLEVVQESNFIKIYPLKPLSPASNYLAVILKRACQGPCAEGDPGTPFTDINGVMVREPLLYEFLKLDEPLTGAVAALEDLRLKYAPIYNDLLPLAGIDKDNTLEVFTLTTADKTLSVQDFGALSAYLQQFVTGQGDMTLDDLAAAIGESTNLPYSAVSAEYDGIHASLPEMTGVNLNSDLEPEPGVFISIDIAASTPDNPVRTTLEYELFNGEAYDPAAKTIALYQHSWNWSKENIEYIVGPNGLPLPGIGIDLPFHGSRVNPGIPSGAEFFSVNLPQNRINLYQSYVDMTIFLRNLRAGLFDLDGDGVVFIPGFTEPDPDDVPNQVFFIGNSLGAITGSVFASYNIDALDKIVLNTGAANTAALFDSSPNLESLMSGLGVDKNSTEYFTTLGVLQLLMDPADPVNLVKPAISAKTLIQSAFGDRTTSNVVNRILAAAAGHPQQISVVDMAASPPAEPGWYMFGGAPDRYVAHEFLLWPNVGDSDDRFDPDYVLGAYETARDQVARFLTD